jgi:nicotinate-nucleotide pyrophosphorylase (carboxylating)
MQAKPMHLLPSEEVITSHVRSALDEDVGTGDLTAQLIAPDSRVAAGVLAREDCVVCGRPWFDAVFAQLDPGSRVEWMVVDGDRVKPGQQLCRVVGVARAVLTGERTALNYLQTLSGTATFARQYADAVAGTGVRILDTRKTLPGLRLQQKYAVRCGGCHNHRMGLYDAILIKENHIAAAGSLRSALRSVARVAPGVVVEVEVETLEQLREALLAGAKRILLDNFSLGRLREAVRITAGTARLEASGGVSLATVRTIAETGVDDISVGALTKHVRAVDLSMRFG